VPGGGNWEPGSPRSLARPRGLGPPRRRPDHLHSEAGEGRRTETGAQLSPSATPPAPLAAVQVVAACSCAPWCPLPKPLSPLFRLCPPLDAGWLVGWPVGLVSRQWPPSNREPNRSPGRQEASGGARRLGVRLRPLPSCSLPRLSLPVVASRSQGWWAAERNGPPEAPSAPARSRPGRERQTKLQLEMKPQVGLPRRQDDGDGVRETGG